MKGKQNGPICEIYTKEQCTIELPIELQSKIEEMFMVLDAAETVEDLLNLDEDN